MILSVISKDKWTVLAPEKPNGDIPLMDFLRDGKNNRSKDAMLGMLLRQVPTDGPPESPLLIGSLGGGLREFKKSPRNGAGVRVAFFHDENKLIICTHGFYKDQRKTDPEQIKKARKFKNNYFEAKKNKSLTIEE